jgi:hypothetical protein
MKRLLLVVTLVLAISAGDAAVWASPATDPSSFTLNIHVSKSTLEIVPDGKLNSLGQRLDVTIDGRHLVLEGNQIVGKKKIIGGAVWLLPVGDYKARIKKEDTAPNGAYWREYEILLKDGSTWDCYVFGESE